MNFEEILGNVDGIVREMNHDNANTQNSAASKMYGIAEAFSKPYFLSKINPVYADNHRKGKVYINDLGYYGLTWNCFFNPLGKMLQQGFENGVGTIRPPKRIASAVALACIILQSSQNDMFGGQGFLRFDADLAPYVTLEYEFQKKLIADSQYEVAYDEERKNILAMNRTDRAVAQAMEAFVYNMNTMRSRSGAQVTFSSVNFGTDTSWQGRMISRNLLKAYINGLGKGENPIFPNLCFKLKDGVNLHEGEPNFSLTELAIECVGKRIQPRFVFCDSEAYAGMPLENIGTMGCRTAVRGDVNGTGDTDARGNLFFNTISLPYIALEAEGDVEKFEELFEQTIGEAIGELLERYHDVAKLKLKDVPFVTQWWQGHDGLSPEDSVEPMLKHGSLSMGFVGLAECLVALFGVHHGESAAIQQYGLELIGRMRKATDAATKAYGLNFALFASPAESACYTMLKKARDQFGIVEGVTDKEYFTNSTHLPVAFKCSMKKKVDIEAPYHLLCNAGHIFYIETGTSPKHNPQGVLHLLQYIAKSGVVYGGINWVHDLCNDCGFQGTFTEGHCPECGSENYKETKIITGYLSTEDHFNPGKVAESRDRVSHAGGGSI